MYLEVHQIIMNHQILTAVDYSKACRPYTMGMSVAKVNLCICCSVTTPYLWVLAMLVFVSVRHLLEMASVYIMNLDNIFRPVWYYNH